MSRYIDADELLEKIKEYPYGYRGMIESDIADMPTADVQEEKRGRWLDVVGFGQGRDEQDDHHAENRTRV